MFSMDISNDKKQLYGYSHRKTDEISQKKTWTELRKENFKRERDWISSDFSTTQRHNNQFY